MVLKKKLLNILHILSLVTLFIIFCGLSSTCYGFTQDEITSLLDDFKVIINNSTLTDKQTYINNVDYIKSNLTLSDYENLDSIFIYNTTLGSYKYTYMYLFNYNNNLKFYFNNNQYVYYNSTESRIPQKYFSCRNSTNFSRNSSYFSTGENLFCNDPVFATNIDIYTNNTFTTISDNYNKIGVPQNTITLETPITSFHRYYGLSDKGQLQVTLTGDYTIEDFTFFIEQNLDNQWQRVTGINDYYLLYDNENNDIYRNPYYIIFSNISYLQTGTYRFCALLNDNPETVFYSSNFVVVPWTVTENVTGTVDSSGNVDISVDTGNTVENIADYFSSPANFDNALSQNDIDNALNLDFMENPYQNFILTFFNGLVSSFSDNASSISFKVHTWGESRIINVSDIAPSYNNDIRVFLTIMSTIVWSFAIVRWCTKILDGLTHFSLQDSVDLIDAHYSDLF